jgi:hypothetical protein
MLAADDLFVGLMAFLPHRQGCQLQTRDPSLQLVLQ